LTTHFIRAKYATIAIHEPWMISRCSGYVFGLFGGLSKSIRRSSLLFANSIYGLAGCTHETTMSLAETHRATILRSRFFDGYELQFRSNELSNALLHLSLSVTVCPIECNCDPFVLTRLWNELETPEATAWISSVHHEITCLVSQATSEQ
jgi:hypothetical protein